MPQTNTDKEHGDLKKLSHDLRNGLGAIYNYAQLLEISLGKKDMKREADIAQEIVKAVEEMEALIKDRIDSVSS